MIRPVGTDQAPQPGRAAVGGGSSAASAFEQVLSSRLAGSLRFSHHAQQRLAVRGLDLAPMQVNRLEQAVLAARQKGARETLVLLNRHAFIVNVASGTVVTAMSAERNRVFTHIDSAVIVEG